MNSNKRFNVISPITGTNNIVSADSIYEAIQKVVELDNYVLSNVEYFKVNEVKKPQRVFMKTDYKLN